MTNFQKVDMETRLSLVERVESGEISAAEAAKEAGVTPPTVAYWIKQEKKKRGESSPLDLVDPAQGLAAKIKAKKSAAAASAKEELRRQEEEAIRVVQALATVEAEREHLADALEATKAQIETALADKNEEHAAAWAAALTVFDKAALKRQGFTPPAQQTKSKRSRGKQPQEQPAEQDEAPTQQNGDGWDEQHAGQQPPPWQYEQAAEADQQLGT